jgi:hypothetical protein
MRVEPRRRQVSAHVPAASSRRMTLIVASALVLVLGLVASIVVIAKGRTEPLKISAYHGALPKMTPGDAYSVTYDVKPDRADRYSEELSVRRPFESVDANLKHGTPFLETVMRLGDEVISTGPDAATLVHTALSPTKRDVRLDVVARDAIRAHRLRVVGRSRVLNTTCYIVRSAAALNAGPLEPLAGTSYVDSCIDRRGLVLFERTTRNGHLVEERIATHVATGSASVRRAAFAMRGRAIPASRGGGGVRELTIDSRPPVGPFWDITAPPVGFRHRGRFAVVPSQPQAYDTPPTNPFEPPGSLVASIDDVYVRGHDAIVIEQGSTVNDAKFTPPSGGIDVDLGPVLGRGQLLLAASGSEVDAEPDEGVRFVRIVGTVPPEELIALARSMTLQPHGTERLK